MLKVNETTKNLINTIQTQCANKIRTLEDILKKNNVELKEVKIELKEVKIELQEKNSEIAQQDEAYKRIHKKMLEMEEKNGQIAMKKKEGFLQKQHENSELLKIF